MISEAQFRDFVKGVDVDHAFMLGEERSLVAWTKFFELEGNQFLIETLRVASQALRSKIREWQVFVATNFFVLGNSRKMALHPQLNIDREGTGDPKDVLRYEEYAEELGEYSRELNELYTAYRRAVKTSLFI